MKHYDYIFCGSGLAALLTVNEMICSEKFSDKSILLIDSDSKITNDRTWCFWDDTAVFDEIVSKKWNEAVFANDTFQRKLDLDPYQYKMIKGLDFYNHIFGIIARHKNVHFLNDKVVDSLDLGKHCVVKTLQKSFTCNKIFNSIFNPKEVIAQQKYPFIQQHFLGWYIETKEAVFTPEKVTFMDFSVEQKNNTRFMYVLPFSKNKALIEYTLFSANLLPKETYENEIKSYIKKLGITSFTITETEQGNIPMTCYPFWKHNTKNIINIGSAGGWTKASTGYTFKNAAKKAKKLVPFLTQENNFKKFHKKDKFWFYDLLLLDVLSKRNDLGSTVFSSLFHAGSPTLIFKFLDEETSLLEDLKVILKCPKKPFIKALVERLF